MKKTVDRKRKHWRHIDTFITYTIYVCTISYTLLFWAALTHAMINWGLTIQYKREREEKRKKRANPVNCHHIYVIKSTLDKGTTDYETDVWMLQYIYIYIYNYYIDYKKEVFIRLQILIRVSNIWNRSLHALIAD